MPTISTFCTNFALLMHKFFSNPSLYPIKLCMSLEFSKESEPAITVCTNQEKGSAITQMIHSTVIQMHDMKDIQTIKKLITMLNNFVFYKISLCNDIHKNVECLKNFMMEYKYD